MICLAVVVSNTAAQVNTGSGESKQMTCNIFKLCYGKLDTTECPIWYTFQPPSELMCNPKGSYFFLICEIAELTWSGEYSTTWYWSRCVHDAGVSGIPILPRDYSDAFLIQTNQNKNTYTNQLIFIPTNSTLGYYWCEISSNAGDSFRLSPITPVLEPSNTSLPQCNTYDLYFAHNHRSDCAIEGSPHITHAPLPSFCPTVSILILNGIQITLILLFNRVRCQLIVLQQWY